MKRVLVVIVILLLVILALLLMGAIAGLAVKLLWWALLGLVIGALARLVLPGEQGFGILATALFGIAGSLLGGILGDAFGLGSILQFLLAIAVAAVLIATLGPRFSRSTA
jgi:uncharacterized membrane protein YeaQ/YmgE (transglycosylase-associated protein family)